MLTRPKLTLLALALAAALWWWIGRQPLRPATPGL